MDHRIWLMCTYDVFFVGIHRGVSSEGFSIQTAKSDCREISDPQGFNWKIQTNKRITAPKVWQELCNGVKSKATHLNMLAELLWETGGTSGCPSSSTAQPTLVLNVPDVIKITRTALVASNLNGTPVTLRISVTSSVKAILGAFWLLPHVYV